MWRGGSDLRLEDVDMPQPGSGEVLLRVLATGICGSDVGRFTRPASDPVSPLILGHETVGEVAAATETSELRIGTRVAVFSVVADGTCASCRRGQENLCASRSVIGGQRHGAFAEFVAVPARNCYAISSAHPREIGALAEPFACALHAIEQGRVWGDDRVLVLGAGGIGQLLATAATILGLRGVVAADRSDHRRAAVKEAGAIAAVDLLAMPKDELDVLTGGAGFDVVIDTVGTSDTRRQAVDQVRAGGRVVVFGQHDPALEVSARRVIRDEVSIIGSFAFTRSSFAAAVDMVDRGMLDGVFARCALRGLEDGPRSFRELATTGSSGPRVILTP